MGVHRSQCKEQAICYFLEILHDILHPLTAMHTAEVPGGTELQDWNQEFARSPSATSRSQGSWMPKSKTYSSVRWPLYLWLSLKILQLLAKVACPHQLHTQEWSTVWAKTSCTDVHNLPSVAGERLGGEGAKSAALQSTFFGSAWDFPATDWKSSGSRNNERVQEETKKET